MVLTLLDLKYLPRFLKYIEIVHSNDYYKIYTHILILKFHEIIKEPKL